jgi:hypothetical protein
VLADASDDEEEEAAPAGERAGDRGGDRGGGGGGGGAEGAAEGEGRAGADRTKKYKHAFVVITAYRKCVSAYP